MLSNNQHIALLDTIYQLLDTTNKSFQSCQHLKNSIRYLSGKLSQCGFINVQHGLSSARYNHFKYYIQVRMLLYIWTEFLEINLVGGLRTSEYYTYLQLLIKAAKLMPSSKAGHSEKLLFTFYGSHPPFTTVITGNLAIVEGYFGIANYYSSLKLRYSVMDIPVSMHGV